MGLQAEDLPVFGQRIAPTLIRVFYYLGLSAVAIACSCRRLASHIFWTIGVPLGFIDACGRSELLGSALERCGTPRSDMRLLTRVRDAPCRWARRFWVRGFDWIDFV